MSEIPFFTSTELTKESFQELLPFFFEEMAEDSQVLKKYFLQKKYGEVRQLAHKIKGGASSYSAVAISEAARYLQEYMDAGKVEELETAILKLETSITDSLAFAKKEFSI